MDLSDLYDPCFLLHLFSELTRPGNCSLPGGLRGHDYYHNYQIRTLILKIILEGSSAAFSPFHSSDFQQSNS